MKIVPTTARLNYMVFYKVASPTLPTKSKKTLRSRAQESDRTGDFHTFWLQSVTNVNASNWSVLDLPWLFQAPHGRPYWPRGR